MRICLLFTLFLLSACTSQFAELAPKTPTSTPHPARLPTHTHTPTVTPTEAAQTAIVRQPVVNVRDAANGKPTGKYIYAGQSVVILEKQGDWIRIAEPPGWVFSGCLEGSEKGCIAK